MKDIRWNAAKNEWLRIHRGVTFEELLLGDQVATRGHPSRPFQKLLLIYRDRYIWVVPYVEEEHCIFLKTAYPSRNFTRAFYRGESL